MEATTSISLPMKTNINTVKSIVPLSSSLTPIPSGNQMATTREGNLHMPEEIIINILKRLPVKSLIRFQCVCTDWRKLFKSSFFIQERSTDNNPVRAWFSPNSSWSPLSLLRYDHKMETLKVERIPVKIDSTRSVSGIMGSCNGLLCVSYGYDGDTPDPSLAFLNPATREVMEIPRYKYDIGNYDNVGWGFGYSHVVQDYKIVAIRMGRYRDRYSSEFNFNYIESLKVFSLRNWSWKEVEKKVYEVLESVELDGCHPVTVNGVIFWLERSLAIDHGKIVSFDLALEVFTMIPIPSSIISGMMFLDVYENKVAMIHGHEYTSIDIWVLEEGSDANGKSWCWTKKHSVIPPSLPSPSPSFYPECLWRNEIVFRMILDDSRSLFILNSNSEFKKLQSSLSKDEAFLSYSFFYVESLVSIHDTFVE